MRTNDQGKVGFAHLAEVPHVTVCHSGGRGAAHGPHPGSGQVRPCHPRANLGLEDEAPSKGFRSELRQPPPGLNQHAGVVPNLGVMALPRVHSGNTRPRPSKESVE